MDRPPSAPTHPPVDDLLEGINAVFESLGRGLICLGPDFRVVHAPAWLDRLTCWLGRERVFHLHSPDTGAEADRRMESHWAAAPVLMTRMTAFAELACRALLGGGLGLALRAPRPTLPTENHR